MSDTLSSDPAAQVAEVRRIIEGRTFMHSCESTLLEIRHVVVPDRVADDPVERDDLGWPKLRPSDPKGEL